MGKDTTLALLPGTLELLILKTLTGGALHGYAIAQRVKTRSEDRVILAIHKVLNAT